MLDLVDRIESALENPNAAPWLPELTNDLAKVGWGALDRDIGITINNYGTARVLSARACTPQNIIARLSTYPGDEGSKSTICVESLPNDLARHYHEAGISFYTLDEIKDTKVLGCLEDAISILNRVPTLMPTVITLVRALHVIKPEDDDYDVSFSEPDIPFSIFISVPRKRGVDDALRVAEAIVHEAMHLQLTLVELIVPLVNTINGRYFSPWRREYRNVQGVLHALYVFRVIDRILEHLAFANSCVSDMAEYVQARRDQINLQIREVQFLSNCSELTIAGTCFVKRLIQS